MARLNQCTVCAWEAENGPLDPALSNVAAGKRIGITESSVRNHRKNHAGREGEAATSESVGGTLELGPDGGSFSGVPSDKPISDWSEVFRQFNLDPEAFSVVNDTVRMRVWQSSKRTEDGDRDVINLYSYGASFRRIDKAEASLHASVLERIRGFQYIPAERATVRESLIVAPSDLQTGKVDWNGSSDDTRLQAIESFGKAADFAREFRPAEICIVDAGDPIENIWSTSSQLGTNDLSLDRQIEAAFNIFLTGLQMLAPLAPKIRFAAVSSNHGQVRTGPKAPAGDAHADFGLAIAGMLRRALKLNPEAFGHVTVQTPEPYMESLSFETSGSRIGVVHGHQVGSADKLGEWWRGQALGNMPTADARILISGHWHSARYYQTGDARHVMVCPSSDRGSSWFTNLKGDSSTSGMLSFTTADNEFDHWRII